MERLPAVLALSELASIPLEEGIHFRPVRRPLGVTAFGVNAYSSDAGRVIEDHDELGAGSGGHEELYFVATGHALFEIDGDEIDAPAGTLLLIQPEQRRGATVREPGTTVLVIGGKPGAAGPLSPFEYWYAAIGKDPAQAYAITAEGLEHHAANARLQEVLAELADEAGRPEDAQRHRRLLADL